MNLMCILNLQPLHKAQSIGKPMKRTSAHTDATEHAYDDNTGPRGSDATERAATIEVMTTPACDAATDGRRLGAATEHAKLVVTERAHAQAYS